MTIDTNEIGHMTKIAALPIYDKNLKIFFSRSNGMMAMEFGM